MQHVFFLQNALYKFTVIIIIGQYLPRTNMLQVKLQKKMKVKLYLSNAE